MRLYSKIIVASIICLLSVLVFGLSSEAASEPAPILTIDGQTITLDVGEVVDLTGYFFGYVDNKEDLNWLINDNDTIYFVKEDLKIYALKAGSIGITVRNDDRTLESNFTIEVRKINLFKPGNLESLPLGSQWKTMNQSISSWVLYTGNSVVKNNQIVKIDEVERDGNSSKVAHASHAEIAYSTLYQYVDLQPGSYYVELDIKGENLSNNVFARINQGKEESTQTDPKKGTFDWQRFTSTPVKIYANDPKLKIELYGANFSGDVWYDNIGVYKVISSEYLSFDLNTNLINLTVDEVFQMQPEVFPASNIDFKFTYEIEDDTIASVTDDGQVMAHQAGYTQLTVTDNQYGQEKSVYIIVGEEKQLTKDLINITMYENTTNYHAIEVEGSSQSIEVFPYTQPLHGDYYIDQENRIVYSPDEDFNSNQTFSGTGEQNDCFKVIVYEKNNGYQIVDVEIVVQAVDSAVVPVDFWLTTPKNTTLSNGYLEYIATDIETEIPATIENDLKVNNKIVRKEAAYNAIYMTLANDSLNGETKNGGTVTLLHDGKGQLIRDRYYSVTGKIIFGSMYQYTPPKDFVGYDTFDVKIINGAKISTFTVTVYVLPGLEDFKFDQTNFDGVYLLTNNEWLEETRKAYENGDPYLTKWVEYYTDRYRVFNPTGVPAKARGPLEQLSILYQVTGDKRYADLAWQQMNEVTKDNTAVGGDGTKRASWGQDSNGFLDAAMVTYSVSMSYNYIYDTLTDDQREQVVRALYEEGFYWYENLNNPNVLLHGNNHGILIGANMATAALGVMSYADDIAVSVDGNSFTINVQEMASEIVTFSYNVLQVALVHYSPSGGYPEGPSYSYYAHRNIVGLMSTMYNIYGADEEGKIYDFGLSDIMGIVNYPIYTLYTSTPNYDTFYYNEGTYSINQPTTLWYARMDDDYIPYTMLNKIADEREAYNILSLIWYKPGSFDDVDISTVRPLDALLEVHEIASFRNSFGDPFGIFTALKGFDPDSSLFTHKSLDSGTFEIVALGEKFIENFSDEDYHTSVPPGYWDMEYGRWTYYKKQTQGHNTLVFNPIDNPVIQQDPNAKASIVKFESSSDGGYAIVDLTDAYASDVLQYQRGLMLDENRGIITLQDEFTLRKESEVYWAAHTEANIEIINDKFAVLTLNGKKLYAHINSELGSFTSMPAEALPGTVGNFHNTTNDGINKLMIHLESVTKGTLSVTFTPSLSENTEVKVKDIVSLENWSVGEIESSDIRVDDISFDAVTGNQYKYEFNPTQYTYLVKLAANEQRIPQLNVEYDATLYEVEITNATQFGDVSTIKVTEKSTGLIKEYVYRFTTDVFVSGYDEFTQWEVKSVDGKTDDLQNLIDNNKNTRWSGIGREEVLFEFEDIQSITNIGIRFSGGAIYQYYFDIYAGNSVDDMKMVYFAGQSNYEIGDEVYTLGDVKAKYIKIVFKGNNDTGETLVSDVKFYQNLEDYNIIEIEKEPTTNPWIIVSFVAAVLVIGASITGVVVWKKRGVS